LKNAEIAKIFYEMAAMLEAQGVDFKPRAYRNAAMSIETLGKDIEEIYKEGKLKNISGVGESLANKITEYIETGKIKAYEKMKKKFPVDMHGLTAVEGIGPKTARTLYKKLSVKTLSDLHRAARHHKIRKIKGLGKKVEKNILENIGFAKESGKRIMLGKAFPSADTILKMLQSSNTVENAVIAGSLRRMKETIGDVDILAISKNPSKTMDFFTKMKGTRKVLAKGSEKSAVILDDGLHVDLRIVPKESWGSALMYFTGSKEHNVELRKLAIKKGLKLSEYGLFRGKKSIAGKTEEDVYRKLNLQSIPPELRENMGEIELASKKKIPELVELNDIQGDLHTHTKWSDASDSVEEMAKKADSLGYKYICITDHGGNLRIANSLDWKRVKKQRKEIDKVNRKTKVKVLQGLEVNVKKDGTIDVPELVLKELDVVVAGVHASLKQDEKTMTKRLLKALDNKHVDILAHPTCRLINERKPILFNKNKVFQKAADEGIVLEIDAQPSRLDLNDVDAKKAIDIGCMLSINTDAHSAETLEYMKYGVATARRAWATKKDVLNCLDLKKLMKKLK